jgi:eukaryotic-like serine/threonine-protein kinase
LGNGVSHPDSLIGRTLGHYCLVEKIGVGGMGEVYRARDEHLRRDVAVKVLPTGTLTDEAARKRFRQEAHAHSRINHPNIATVFDFDTQEDTDFLVTELIPGVSLDDALQPGPFAETEVLRLGIQLAEGLEAAHRQEIIHRDLKPANLRLTPEGQLKILDFGLATIPSPAAEADLTQSVADIPALAGTLPYMSPEQLHGVVADARSDVYAAGVVLYEMATGRRPFEQKLSTALVSDIIQRPPPPPKRLNPAVSPRLEDVILKCLEKKPDHRYQSAQDLLIDLRWLAATGTATSVSLSVRGEQRRWAARLVTGAAMVLLGLLVVGLNLGGFRDRLLRRAPAARLESLAVLPLANFSGDPEQQYFADGMTEELIARLSRIGSLKVISRTSVMQYKDTKKALPEIARELNVDGVVEGSVLKAGNRVRITAQLIQAKNDRHLWAQSYDRDLSDILQIQSDVATAIAREISTRLNPTEQGQLVRSAPVDPQAYEAYLKGRFYSNQRTQQALSTSINFFQQAIARDPNYALAYSGLADSYALLAFRGNISNAKDALSRAKAAALKAIELDDSLGEPHASHAFIAETHEWDWATAEREYKRALQLNPGDAHAHHLYAGFLIYTGRFQDGVAEEERARELDPLSLTVNNALAGRLLVAGRINEALEQLRKTLSLDPNYAPAHQTLGWAYLNQGKHEAAIQEFQRALQLSGNKDTEFMVDLGYAYAAAGSRGQAETMLAVIKDLHRRGFASSGSVAILYGALGEPDHAFAWLEKAYEEHAPELTYLKVPGRRFAPLQSDPRFADFLRRMNLPP